MKDHYPNQCPRCLKHLGIRYDETGIHTCTPTEWWGKMEAENKRLRIAAQAVIDRWDSPLWKDQPHTGNYISDLREALK